MEAPDLTSLAIYCDCTDRVPVPMTCVQHNPALNSVLLPLFLGVGYERAIYQCTICSAQKVATWYPYGDGRLEIRDV